MIDQLHVYLRSEVSGFDFDENAFDRFRARFADTELVFLKDEQAVLRSLSRIEWLDTWQFDEAWFLLAPRLRGLFTPAAGKDWVAEDPRRIVPTYFGTFHGPMIAETLLGLMLHFSRAMPVMLARQQERIWDRDAQSKTRLLSNQRALIVGYGNIGKHCGRVLTQRGMTVHGVQRHHRSGIDASTGVEYVHQDDLQRHLGEADHVILLIPGGQETENFMGEAEFSAMKPGSYFYNFGRGTTCDEAALSQALESGHLAGAGIDVTRTEPLPPDSALWDTKNLVLLPHSSCIFEEYRSLHVEEVARLCERLIRQGA